MAVGKAWAFLCDREPAGRWHQYRHRSRRCAPTPDGYTLPLVAPANAINATLYDKLPFDFMREIEPIAGIIRFPNVVMVHPSLPIKPFRN